MMRIVKATLLTCAVAALPSVLFAQAAAPAAGGQCQMLDPEYQVYNNANTQTDNKAKATALEAYLTQFPNSCAKSDALKGLIQAYVAVNDLPHAIGAADRVLQLNPNDLDVIAAEAFLHNSSAAAAANGLTDAAKIAAAELPELDKAVEYAQKGLAAAKPANVTDAAFNTAYKEKWYPTFYSVIGNDALQKKDFAGAIDAYKKEIAYVGGDPTLAPQLKTPSSVLQDVYNLATAYYLSTPPDYLNCAYYEAHVVANVPDALKPQYTTLAKYCYGKYHGKPDGFDQLVQLAAADVNPPANLATTITPAPTPAQIIADILKTTTPDQLSTSDKEYFLQNGTPEQAQTVWDSMKGKSFQFPDVLVIASTPQQVQVAIGPDSVQSKTADFTFNLAAPEELPAKATPVQKKAYEKKQADIAEAIQPGKTVTLSGTFDSYTPKPFMITLTDGEVVLATAKKAAPAAHAPAAAHHTPPHRAQ